MSGVLTGRGFPLLTRVPEINARETVVLDFKGEVPAPADYFELAKDVAAMANVQGGTILIGGVEGQGRLARFQPIDNEREVSRIVRAYGEAVRDRCAPPPTIDDELFDCPSGGGRLLAIHIAPSPRAVAVKVRGDATDGWGDPAWVFFQRVASHNQPARPEVVRPEVLPVFMSPEIRHVAIILRNIPLPSNILVRQDYGSQHKNIPEGSKYSMLEVDELANTVRSSNGVDRRYVPLNFIRTVFEDEAGTWEIHVQSTTYR